MTNDKNISNGDYKLKLISAEDKRLRDNSTPYTNIRQYVFEMLSNEHLNRQIIYNAYSIEKSKKIDKILNDYKNFCIAKILTRIGIDEIEYNYISDIFPCPEEDSFYLDVTVDDGKYRIIQHNDGNCEALRYGEKWRDITGDSLILAMAQEIEKLRKEKDDKKWQ